MSTRWKQLLVLAVLLLLTGLGLSRLLQPWDDERIQAAHLALLKREFRAAQEHLDDYLDNQPQDLSAIILAAEASRRCGDYEAARERLRQFARLDGPPLALELEQRLLAVQEGDAEEAALVHRFCMAHPSSPEVPLALEALIVADLNRLAVPLSVETMVTAKDAAPTVARLNQSVELWLEIQREPADQIQGLVWQGRARGLAGDHTGAVAALEQALALGPDHFEAQAYLALSIIQEDPVRSLELMESLLQRSPDDARIQFAVATARRSLGKLDAARQLLDQMLQVRPTSTQILVERALVALDDRDPDQAQPYLERAEALAPDNLEVHRAVVRCLTMKGELAAARQHREQFLKLDAQRSQRAEKSSSP